MSDLPSDPMERLIAEALIEAGIDFASDNDPRNAVRLDFYLPSQDIYIEVKRFASERSAAQLERADNIILAQGDQAVRSLANMIRSLPDRSPLRRQGPR